ncbi:MAG: hypothetical protein WCJ18_02995, partial [Planctomycetota bacterium]
GTKADAERIAAILEGENIDEANAEVRSGLDALIACYVTLRGTEGLDLVDDLFLDRQGRDVPFTETYAAVMALRFLGEESDSVPRERVLQSLRLLLDEPKLADLVIADLARWEDWSVVGRLTQLFEQATADNIFVREPVVNYLKACPLPEAAAAIAKLERIDPEAVRRAATLAGFAGALAPQSGGKAAPAGGAVTTDDADGEAGEPPGGRSTAVDPAGGATADDAALAARIAPVIADEDATDDETALAVDADLTAATTLAADRWKAIKWAVWTAIVLAIAVFSRSALTSRSLPGSRSASGSTTAPK